MKSDPKSNTLPRKKRPQHRETLRRRAMLLVEQDEHMREQLVELRQQQGLTQKQMADRMGVSQSAVSQFENLENDPRLSTLRRYAHAVGVVIVHEVKTDEESPMPEPPPSDDVPQLL